MEPSTINVALYMHELPHLSCVVQNASILSLIFHLSPRHKEKKCAHIVTRVYSKEKISFKLCKGETKYVVTFTLFLINTPSKLLVCMNVNFMIREKNHFAF